MICGWVRGFAVIAFAVLAQSWGSPAVAEEDAALAHARQLLRQTPLVDGHNDTPWLIRENTGGDVAEYDLRKRGPHETDLARLPKARWGRSSGRSGSRRSTRAAPGCSSSRSTSPGA